ncbi:MAG TPA: alpha/beta hydrolase [Caldimonas sp.]|jgi:pimeloyl-ACP methyl ester carboxylesterase|nr:alpha/beta hydrolase [Caldimonas sp.]HEX2542755.1 alpha/beta hydrolase [Caldimonas sp.]
MSPALYVPARPARSRFVEARGLRHHLLEWGERSADTASPPLVMLHGWMDVAASFQFVVDALGSDRHVLALDWRGFGLTDTPAVDTYYFPEYLGDLDAVLDAVLGATHPPIDLLGHSMGGNVAMLYAGVRPQRIRRLVNLEGFGMPRSKPADSPLRIAKWLDSLKKPEQLRPYPSLEAVADRLRKTNPLLRADRAAWLAVQWSGPHGAEGERRLLADPDHKRASPLLAQVDEWLEAWKLIAAPVLWIEGDRTDISIWWGDRYSKAEFHERLNLVSDVRRHVVSPAGHMLHHDRPEDVARLLEAFLSESRPC